jgi:hypothetical protein
MAHRTGNHSDMPEDPDEAMAWLEKLADNQSGPTTMPRRPATRPPHTTLLIVLGIAAVIVFVLLVINLLNFL